MTISWLRLFSSLLNSEKFTTCNLTFFHLHLCKLELSLNLPFLVLASKEIQSFVYKERFVNFGLGSFHGLQVCDTTAGGLCERVQTLLQNYLLPFQRCHIENYHLAVKISQLALSTIHNHVAFVHSCTMMLSRADSDACCIYHRYSSILRIEFDDFVRTLSQFSSRIEHVATTK